MTDDDILSMWTVYDHPRDRPNSFVARRFEIFPDGDYMATCDVFIADTLEKLRALLPAGLVCLQREPTDDPLILETWL